VISARWAICQWSANVRRLQILTPRPAAVVFLLGLLSTSARADALYSVTDLGAASPTANVTGQSQLNTGSGYPYISSQNTVNSNGNYLAALNTATQAAFQARECRTSTY
jgi:hypothetical protein